MATTITENTLESAPGATQTLDPVTAQRYGAAATPLPAAQDASRHGTAGAMIKGRLPDLVKGAGLAPQGGNTVLSDQGDILARSAEAALALRMETRAGYQGKSNVVKGWSPDFLNQFGAFRTALEAPSIQEQVASAFGAMPGGADVAKSFTAGNLGIGSIYGLTPFNLLAPSRLIYPVYTVYRNKFARPAGQGASLIERLITGVSGSQTGGQGVLDISIPELVTQGGSFTSWPLNLPSAGSQTVVTLNVPYRFFGITEQLSWLAQFAGQGYEDLSALANLIMLQEAMLGEEYQMIAGSATSLSTPSAPTCTVRAAQSNETAFNTTITTIKVAAVNYFGSTAVSSTTSVTISASQVVDVTITPVTGAMQYAIYGNDGTHDYLFATVGGVKYTLQGFSTLPAFVTAPTTDSGTGKGTRMEGVVPVLSGLSQGGVYPSGWQGGYYNNNVGLHLNYNTVYTTLKALWDSATGSTTNGPFKADPAEIISSGSDLTNLSQDVISQGTATNYELFITQGDVGNVTVGAAVSQFQNPLTRSLLKLVVHPWYPQGNATFLSYQLPQTYTNVANAWEMSCVQDYVSIAWPVIDATFRSDFALAA